MATITDIKRRIKELSGAKFQEFCDTLLQKMLGMPLHPLGLQSGSGNTTKGNPDSYFRKENGKYIFVAYTTQQTSIGKKLEEDLQKCLDPHKTGLNVESIDEIICCHTSSQIDVGLNERLHKMCEDKGVKLTLYGLDEIANLAFKYPLIVMDFLTLSISTGQILDVDDFIKLYDKNPIIPPLNTIFQHREEEKVNIKKALEENDVVIITGKSGVGKTRLGVEIVKELAKEKGYTPLCIRNKHLDLYKDLIQNVIDNETYLFLVDDANEVSELHLILEERSRAKIKVLCTVRDYAEEIVEQVVEKYDKAAVIDIHPFSDEEIKEFIKANLEITNKIYVDQIICIAEGIPRLAYLAGTLAKQNSFKAIKNALDVYRAYYQPVLDKAFKKDRRLCITFGILSIVKVVRLREFAHLHELLSHCGINENEFSESIKRLCDLKFIERNKKIVVLSDQCFSNYMLYHVIVEKEMIQLVDVIELGFKHFHQDLIHAISTLLKLYGTEDVLKVCKEAVLEVGNKFKDGHDSCYSQYLLSFHIFCSTEAFLVVQKQINCMEREEFCASKIDFNKYIHCAEDSVLEGLTGYYDVENLQTVMELLVKFASKSERHLISAYKWLEFNYGVDCKSSYYGYSIQKVISEFFLDEIENANGVVAALAYQWAQYSLSLTFSYAERRKGPIYYHHNVKLCRCEEIKEFRKIGWKILEQMSYQADYKEKIHLMLTSYLYRVDEENRMVATKEIKYIEIILSNLHSNSILFLSLINILIEKSKELSIDIDARWGGILDNTKWKLYQVLIGNKNSELDREEKIELQKKTIAEFTQTLEIPRLVTYLSDICMEENRSTYKFKIQSGTRLLIESFSKDQLKVFFFELLKRSNTIVDNPISLIGPLVSEVEPSSLLKSIKESQLEQKDWWVYILFVCLLENQVNNMMVEEFIVFLKSGMERGTAMASYEFPKIIEKFLHIKPDLYLLATSIILEKRYNNKGAAIVFLSSLFCVDYFTPQKLHSLYKENLSLLQDIYFFVLENDVYIDYEGSYIQHFLLLGKSWQNRYVEWFWKCVVTNGEDADRCISQTKNLWKIDRYLEFFDSLLSSKLDNICDLNSKIAFEGLFKHLTSNDTSNEVIRERQIKWIEHTVRKYLNTPHIVNVFEFLSNLEDECRLVAIKTFIECNSDFVDFDKLPIGTSSFFGGDSLSESLQHEVDFLKSVLPFISGVKFLKHREKIENKIKSLNERIEKEKEEEFCWQHIN